MLKRRWTSAKVIEALADVMVRKSTPEHLRSDNGHVVLAATLPRLKVARGVDAALAGIEAQHNFAEAQAIPAARIRFQDNWFQAPSPS